MRRQLLKFLLLLLVLLAFSLGLLWLWSWYVFNAQWQVVHLTPVMETGTAVTAGFLAATFFSLTIILIVINYHLIKQS